MTSRGGRVSFRVSIPLEDYNRTRVKESDIAALIRKELRSCGDCYDPQDWEFDALDNVQVVCLGRDKTTNGEKHGKATSIR